MSPKTAPTLSCKSPQRLAQRTPGRYWFSGGFLLVFCWFLRWICLTCLCLPWWVVKCFEDPCLFMVFIHKTCAIINQLISYPTAAGSLKNSKECSKEPSKHLKNKNVNPSPQKKKTWSWRFSTYPFYSCRHLRGVCLGGVNEDPKGQRLLADRSLDGCSWFVVGFGSTGKPLFLDVFGNMFSSYQWDLLGTSGFATIANGFFPVFKGVGAHNL